ncbi:HAMP domain-containing sensor histidine kinase [Microbacterium sp. OVT16B]|uniref:sensor histidine kinase n=1 Tax=Microbacterium sp. OVT16B TaxID=2862682 RepID=UPI001CBC97B5|nr:HAMP domain-containing sensor histidine kinase [Microbacterium sp. OVT16B]
MIVRRARWRLTIGFTTVQLLTFALFAWGVYAFAITAFDFDGVADGGGTSTAEAGFATLRTALIVALSGLCVVAPFTSWLLAGLAMRPVASTLAAQRRFVDDASHELRTPLTAIQGQLELILTRPRTVSEYREACATALEAAHSLASIADDLILAADGGHDRTADAVVELGDALHRVRGLLAAPDRVVVTQQRRVVVAGLPSTVERVLLNLLVNAEKYSDADVDVRIRAAGGWGEVVVRDAGKGMTRAQVRRAFDRFWQADPSRAGEGSGLGLSIVREIVTSLGGRVALTSVPDVGTTVRVRLPLSRSSHAGLRNVGETEVPT